MPLARDMPVYEREQIDYHTRTGELRAGNYKGLDILVFSPRGRDNYYYRSRTTKSMIVLHFTLGFLGGDLAKLTTDDFHVSVPFLIARSGKIIQLFDPDYWSYHLSPGAVGGNTFNSRRSIPIELSNIGPLQRSGRWMWNYYGARYCNVEEREYYQSLAEKYGNYYHFATFTDEQYESLDRLLDVLSREYRVPRRFLSEPDRYRLFGSSAEARRYRAVASHVNYQPTSVKVDIGPAFAWQKIV